MAKLTDISLAPSVTLNSLIHIVNTSDISQDPAGSSYKTPLSTLSPLFGGGGTNYWSASTGTNAIVLKYSNSVASGILAIAEGFETTAIGYYSHAEGYKTSAGKTIGDFGAHAEGYQTKSIGDLGSHSEGANTIASGSSSHAEGLSTIAKGDYGSHAEGWSTIASGSSSHAEGRNTTAAGNQSHAGGYNSKALGITSFVHSSNSTVDVSANRSAIIGGQSITATNADTVYVPNLNINTAPANDNALTQVLVRATDGTVKYKTLGGLASFNWVTVTTNGGSTYNAVPNTGYVSNNGHPSNKTQYLLPSTASVGDIVKVMVIDGRASLTVSASQQIVYGTGDSDTGGSFTAPLDFNFGKYESAEVTYIGSNKWILSNFQTLEDLSSNPLTNRIY